MKLKDSSFAMDSRKFGDIYLHTDSIFFVLKDYNMT